MVIHLAAVAGVRNYHERPVHTLRVNFVGTLNVLDAACAEGVCVMSLPLKADHPPAAHHICGALP